MGTVMAVAKWKRKSKSNHTSGGFKTAFHDIDTLGDGELDFETFSGICDPDGTSAAEVKKLFELVDAEGETWSNIGAAAENGLAAWNTNDTESTTFVNFDGWRQLAVALPGQYPFDNYHWPRNCNWRHRGGNGLVDYPLKLTALVLEMRERIVYIDELVETTSRSLLLGELTVGKAHVE